MAKTKTDTFTAKNLAAVPMVLADAAVYLDWPGSLAEDGDAHVLHYWARGDKLLKHLSSTRWWTCGPGHQYVVCATRREMLQRAGQLIDEVRKYSDKARVKVLGGKSDIEEPILRALLAGSFSDQKALMRVSEMIEGRLEVSVNADILSIESVPANAYRRLETEMASPSVGERGVLWKQTTAGPLLCLAPGAGLHSDVEPGGAGVVIGEHIWNFKASKADVLREARGSSAREKALGAMDVKSGMVVIAKAAISHHVLVPRAKDPLAALRALLKKGETGELKVAKLGKVGGIVAIAPGPYDVLFGATDAVRWCRMTPKQKKAKQ